MKLFLKFWTVRIKGSRSAWVNSNIVTACDMLYVTEWRRTVNISTLPFPSSCWCDIFLPQSSIVKSLFVKFGGFSRVTTLRTACLALNKERENDLCAFDLTSVGLQNRFFMEIKISQISKNFHGEISNEARAHAFF